MIRVAWLSRRSMLERKSPIAREWVWVVWRRTAISNGWLAYCRQLDTCFFEKETLVGVPCASKTLHHNVGGRGPL